MKNLIFPCCLLLAVLACWYGASSYSEKTGAILTESIVQVMDCSADAKWHDASDNMDEFINNWRRFSRIYALYIDEKILSDIENASRKCKSYIRMKDSSLAAGSAAEITGYLDSLIKCDSFTLSGLF